jgi:hypothetical protein
VSHGSTTGDFFEETKDSGGGGGEGRGGGSGGGREGSWHNAKIFCHA